MVYSICLDEKGVLLLSIHGCRYKFAEIGYLDCFIDSINAVL